ncbi:MAG: NAD(+)--dinitrogen-reductase ADP-D-ribosyltransferase [Ideonella sp.]|nr:NAD(+)--dinitrogen-reductase ADP-D-ribosyltransferase [Ideonella sp.]
MAASDDPHPQSWYTTNLVGVPAPVLASTTFNQHPVALSIAGTREAHHGLFALLDNCQTPAQAASVFEHYMALAFGLQPEAEAPGEARRRRVSYLKLLQGWGLDSNGGAGAVLKGWVESRFGIVPGFHKAPLARFPSPAWVGYLTEKAASRWHSNCISQQLDLLYEFCQWSITRWQPWGAAAQVALWRATTRADEQLVEGELRQGAHAVMRLNNIVSFALERDQADCFGDWVLHARVPTAKLLFYPHLLGAGGLAGESEVLAIGGDYDVALAYA